MEPSAPFFAVMLVQRIHVIEVALQMAFIVGDNDVGNVVSVDNIPRMQAKKLPSPHGRSLGLGAAIIGSREYFKRS
jgi:hypothetical protein